MPPVKKVVVKRAIGETMEVPAKKIKKIRTDNKVEKKVKIEIDGTEKTLENLEVTNEHVAKCVDAILQLTEKNAKKHSLLSNDSKIFLQVNCIKTPKVAQLNLRLYLPHTLVGPNDEVALIVADIAKGRRQDYEKTIDHWETKFQQCGVTQIKDILPMNKIKTEYNQYEMRRKLARLYDFFLVDGRIAGHVTHCLGSTFRRFATAPVPIKLNRDNLKEEIDFGLKKVTLTIHGRGNSHNVQVATTSMTRENIIENVIAACEQIKKKYPGEIDNIRSILIKPQTGLSVPVYYSIKNKNQVQVPIVAPKRPKAFKTVEGELSTIEGDVKVKVEPGGRVRVIKKRGIKDTDNKEAKEIKVKKMKKETSITKASKKNIKRKIKKENNK
ncbi:hypothetical protein PV328_007191 [Microctonus aethiopoides]|uniref:Ribosomal protein L1 n=1 Tax=Microctonus aethiopoides TaxID=144406 RepID=A0AA39FQQ3_9HYME|nr:hypothetical protein PV328_007191 [Microctonus aethiopoides]